MRVVVLAGLAVTLVAVPARTEPMEAADPLAPCLAGKPTPDDITPSSAAWGVEIASSFNKQETLDEFAEAKKAYSDILGDYSPTVVAVCDLSMGTDLRYAARVTFDDRDAADKLCAKLQAAGGSCIVLKN